MNGPSRDASFHWGPIIATLFGAAQIAAGIIFFFAYNWRELPDATKIFLPQGALIVAFLVYAGLSRDSVTGRVAGVIALMLIDVSMAVVGQVYQLGADPWRLFATWSVFGFLFAAGMRRDAPFAIATVLASIAFRLFAEQEWRPIGAQGGSLIPALHASGLFAVLLLRETFDDAAPGWLRWFFLIIALFMGLLGAIGDIEDGLFAGGFLSTMVLLIIAALGYSAYRIWRPDLPARALCLFALFAYAGILGVRTIFLADLEAGGDITLALLLSAGWIILVTAMLARLLRMETKRGGAA